MAAVKEIVENLLRQRTPVVFQAGGPSMNPTIRDGDSVRIRPLEPGDPRGGAILLFRKNDRLVLHRAVRRDRRTGHVYAVADAATEGGEWVAPVDLLGAAEWRRRGERLRRLDGATSRMAGWLRHALRPLRRAFAHLRPATHAQAPADRS